MSIYDIIIGGPCANCGFRHPGQTCEQRAADVNRVAKRIAKAIMSTSGMKPKAKHSPQEAPK